MSSQLKTLTIVLVKGHARAAGAHSKTLRMVREKKWDMPLMPARFLKDNGAEPMKAKSRLQISVPDPGGNHQNYGVLR